jgi:site-specific recombinase XerC
MPEGYTMHTLRHRFGTRAYRGSRNLRAVQELLGHASIATTERYTAIDDDEIRAAAMAAAAELPGIGA